MSDLLEQLREAFARYQAKERKAQSATMSANAGASLARDVEEILALPLEPQWCRDMSLAPKEDDSYLLTPYNEVVEGSPYLWSDEIGPAWLYQDDRGNGGVVVAWYPKIVPAPPIGDTSLGGAG